MTEEKDCQRRAFLDFRLSPFAKNYGGTNAGITKRETSFPGRKDD